MPLKEPKRKRTKAHRGRRVILYVLTAVCLALGVTTVALGLWVSGAFAAELPPAYLSVGNGGISPRFYAYRFTDRENRIGEREEITEEVFSHQKTLYVSEEEFPAHLTAAFVAIEDKRFYTHRGVDWYRTVAAGCNYVLGFSDSFGASTITQQLVKNLTGENEVTLRRKLQEIRYALDLERRLDKGEILERYLNVIHFADHCDGIGAAAEHYFAKSVAELGVAESACLAAVINNPTYYHPTLQPEHNRARRELILGEMYRQGYLSEAEFSAAMQETLRFAARENREEISSWYTDMVIEDVISDLAGELGIGRTQASRMLYTGGLTIDVAMDREVQTVVEDYYRTLRSLPVNERGETAQSALIVIDPHTGDVLGVAGAAGEKRANRLQNFATETLRSPGSAIKPISVYAPALARGIIHWGSVYDDVPVRFEGENLRAWPKNADGTYRGLCTVAYAVAHSTNTVAVRILEELGLEESFRFAKEKFHLSSLRRDRTVNDCDVAPLALGQLGYGVTLRELTDAYTVFADRGVYHPWRSYYRVTDAEGRVLLSRADASETVLSEANAAIMTKLLEGVVKEGTSSSITLRRLVECAGKTGTTGEDHDRWFVGYTPDLICGVWCGYEYPAPLAGRNLCTGIWNDVMSRLWDRLGGRTSFSVPASVYRASYCRDSGELLSDACTHDPRGERSAVGWFAKGNAPHAVCDRHVLCDYDVTEGGISHGYCPAESVERVALLRVERQFPIHVRVADAQYVLRGDPMRISPNENANAAYDAAEDRAHHGTSGSSPPYHRSCPVHRAKERTWWQELPPLLPDSEE